jgi:hypothetical protein
MVVAIASPAIALGATATYAPESWFKDYIRVTRRTTNDSVKIGIHPRWNAAGAAAIQGYAADGYRYTQDMHDLHYVLDAYGYYTDFPNPVWDTDDDEPFGSDWKYEESEMTSNSTTFPTVMRNYVFQTKWSHWFFNPCCGYPDWYWDGRSGEIAHESQISFYLGEWQTHKHSGAYDVSTYPAVSKPSAPTQTVALSTSEALATGSDWAVEAEHRVLLDPDLSEGIDRYRSSATDLAERTVGSEPSHVVVTFDRPLDPSDVLALMSAGLEIRTIELAAMQGDIHVTYGGRVFDGSELNALLADAGADSATVLGFVSAEALITSAGYQGVSTDNRVYLIDFALEAWMREHPGSKAILDDVFWQRAGWE